MEIKSAYIEGKYKTRKRTELLNIAYKLFVEKGIENVTIIELAEACGLERRSLYNYYKDKEEIALDLMRCWYENVGAIIIVNDENKNAFEQVKAITYQFYEFAINDPDAIRYSAHFDHYFRSKYSDEGFTTYITEKRISIWRGDLFEQGIKDGSLDPRIAESTVEYAMALEGAIFAFAQRLVFTDNEANKELLKIAIDSILYAIKKK